MTDTSSNTRSQIHLVGGRKGGVGKTFLSRHIAEYLTQKQQQFALIEADVTIGDVGTVYGGYEDGHATAAQNLNLSDDPKRYSEPDVIFHQAIEKQCVLVNLPAETNDALARWMKAVNLIELCEEGNIDIYHWYVTDGCYASIRLLADSLNLLDRQLPHIVIRNEGRLNGVNFDYLNDEPLYQEIITAPNTVCIHDFPVLGSAEQFYLDKNNLTYQEGVAAAKDHLGLIQAQRIKTFTEQAIAVLDRIFNESLSVFQKKSPERKHRPRSEPTQPSDTATEQTELLNEASIDPAVPAVNSPSTPPEGSPEGSKKKPRSTKKQSDDESAAPEKVA